MAFTKNEKTQMMEQYGEWLDKSQAMFMLSYEKMDMPTIDAIRSKIREAGGEAHVVKNTLITRTLADKEYPAGEELTGTTLANFAFTDAAAVAKAVSGIVKDYNMKIKYGYLDKGLLSGAEVAKLGTLPSLPEMLAKLPVPRWKSRLLPKISLSLFKITTGFQAVISLRLLLLGSDSVNLCQA